MYRHGDVLIAPVSKIPKQAKQRPRCVLAEGELTGHSHRIEESGVAELYEFKQELFLRVVADHARVIHQEHAPIDLPRGTYRVWRQREYSPEEIRVIRD